MCPEIEIDDQVFEYLKQHAEPFIDQPNDVLRRLLLSPRVPSTTESRQAPVMPARITDNGSPSARKVRPSSKGPRSRAPSDALLPEAEYEMPILRVLDDAGGRAPTSEVISAVGEILADRFKPMDLEAMERGRPRWEIRTQFARMHMVKRGLLDPSAPRGVWAIASAGQDLLKDSTVPA